MLTTPESTYGQASLVLRSFCVVAYVVAIAVNATVGQKNGEVSNKYQLRVTPPGYFFAIWGVIYITTFIAMIWATYTNVWSNRSNILFITYCGLNCLWIVVFTLGTPFWCSAAAPVLAAMVVCQYFLWVSTEISQMALEKFEINSGMYYFMRLTLAFQLGWLTAAFLLNFTIMEAYGLNIPQTVTTPIFWILVVVLQALVTFIGFQQCNKDPKTFFQTFSSYYLSAAWAILGAAISTAQRDKDAKLL